MHHLHTCHYPLTTVGEGTIVILLKKPTNKHMLRVGDVVILTRRIKINGQPAWATRSPDPHAKKKQQRYTSLMIQNYGKYWARCPLAAVQVRMLVSKYGLSVGDVAKVIGQSGCKNFWKLKMPGVVQPFNVLVKTRGSEWVETKSRPKSNSKKKKSASSSATIPAVTSSPANDSSVEPRSVTSQVDRAHKTPKRVKRSSPRKRKLNKQKAML